MRAIRWLGLLDCDDPRSVGGKAASLSRHARRHRVPAGFAITAMSPARDSLTAELGGEIRSAYQVLGERSDGESPAVAVRSSAVDEDGASASFAGQHDTYLNIRGAAAVGDAVLRCLQSAASAEAMAYRAQRRLSMDDVRMAVLVQELVASDVSAVVFSANPVTGSRDEIVINSNWGLGESIVGGSATPDGFIVRKEGLELSLRAVAKKSMMSVLSEAGTADVEVPLELQLMSSLTDEQVRQMATLAITLEREVGSPVDVECALAGGTLYLLQCRPITTLS